MPVLSVSCVKRYYEVFLDCARSEREPLLKRDTPWLWWVRP